MIQDLGLAVALQDGEGLFVMTLVLLEPMVQIVQAHACVRIRAELQRRIFEDFGGGSLILDP